MIPPKKKPAVEIAVGIGKPKDELGTPDPLDKMAEHEADETPDEEEGEETGSDLLGAMTKPLTDAGLSDEDARSMLADVLDAACKALRGGGKADTHAEESGEGEGDAPGRYGR